MVCNVNEDRDKFSVFWSNLYIYVELFVNSLVKFRFVLEFF